METLFQELKRYVLWGNEDEAALRALHPFALPHLEEISIVFYDRILDHEEAKKVLEGGESMVGRLKVTLQAWMDSLMLGPWDEAYFHRRARIGRMHVRIGLPQHYMLGAMNVLRQEFDELIDASYPEDARAAHAARIAIGKIFDLELAIMLHTYREDLDAQRSRHERLATFGQLVGSIGHELRNPLGVIESSLYILQGRIGEDVRARKHVDRISEQLVISNQIISDLLDMIRDRPLERGPTRLGALIESVVGALKRPEGVSIAVSGFDALPELDADASKLRQVLMNLVENAVHAVGSEGSVGVRAELWADEVVLTVDDTGPGVDPNIKNRLFEPLITTKTKGIGLGLPLVKRVVERHGGSVAYSASPAGGARFTVRLPVGGTSA